MSKEIEQVEVIEQDTVLEEIDCKKGIPTSVNFTLSGSDDNLEILTLNTNNEEYNISEEDIADIEL